MRYQIYNEAQISRNNRGFGGCVLGPRVESHELTEDLDDALDSMDAEHEAFGDPMRVEEAETGRVVGSVSRGPCP